MKTLSLKTLNVLEGISIFEDCDIIETLDISDVNYACNLYKVTSDIPFHVYNYFNNNFIETTTDFTSSINPDNSWFKIKGTLLNQIIYIRHLKKRNNEDFINFKFCRILKVTPSPKMTFSKCVIEDIPHSIKTFHTYSTIDMKLDISSILGGSDLEFVFLSYNQQFLDISKIADTFARFLIVNTYVGNINIVDYFANRTYALIMLSASDFIGDICDLAERYFNNNKFLTFVFETQNIGITLYNKSLIGTYDFLIIVEESGITIKKGDSISGPFEETILTYNGSTWEGSWI